MAEPRARRGDKTGRGGGGSGTGMKLIASLFGGGGENPAYGEDPGQVEVNPDIAQYGTENPYKPLNWLGRAMGNPDPYTQYRTFSAESGLQSGAAREMEAIRFDHQRQLQAIENSNLSDRQKDQARMQAENETSKLNNEVLTRHGVIANPQNVGAWNSATSGMIPTLAPASIQGTLDAQKARTALEQQQAKRLNYFEMAPGSGIMGMDQLGQGIGVTLEKQPTMQERMMAQAMGLPLEGPNTFQFTKNGQPFSLAPRNMASGITGPGGLASTIAPLLGTGFNPNALPAAPTQAAAGPAAMYSGWGDALLRLGARGMPGFGANTPQAQSATQAGGAPMLSDEQAALINQAIEEARKRRLAPSWNYGGNPFEQ